MTLKAELTSSNFLWHVSYVVKDTDSRNSELYSIYNGVGKCLVINIHITGPVLKSKKHKIFWASLSN